MQRLWSRPVVFIAATVVTGAGGAFAPAVAATPNPGVCNVLSSVAAVSSTNVWAVGNYCTSSHVSQTLVLHYNGTSWTTVASPNVGGHGSELDSIAVVSPANVWAVGYYDVTGHGAFKPLIEHWNGSGWKVIASGIGTRYGNLRALTVVSRTNVWAVGHWSNASGTTGGALIEHWNGTSWKVTAASTNSFFLHGVSAVAANDIWATGERFTGGRDVTLAMHWNGTSWRAVAAPNAGTKSNFLEGGVKAFTSTDVWTVGWRAYGSTFRPLAMHWNGIKWTLVTPVYAGDSYLFGIDGSSGSDVWAVGRSGRATLVEHWNGHTWSATTGGYGSGANALQGVAALSPTRAFAVGSRTLTSSTSRTLALRWSGGAWRPM